MKFIILKNIGLLFQSVTFFIVLKLVPIEKYNEFVLFTVSVGYALFGNLGISNGIIYFGQDSDSLDEDNTTGLIFVILIQLLIGIYFQNILLTLACVFANASNYLKSTSRLFGKSYYLQILFDLLYTLTLLITVLVFNNYDLLIEIFILSNIIYLVVHVCIYFDFKLFKIKYFKSKRSLKLLKHGLKSLQVSAFFILWPLIIREQVANSYFIINQELFYMSEKLLIFFSVLLYYFTPNLIKFKSKNLFLPSIVIMIIFYFGMLIALFIANYLFKITVFNFHELHEISYYSMIIFMLGFIHASLIKDYGLKLSIYFFIIIASCFIINQFLVIDFKKLLVVSILISSVVSMFAFRYKFVYFVIILGFLFPGELLNIRITLFLILFFFLKPLTVLKNFHNKYAIT